MCFLMMRHLFLKSFKVLDKSLIRMYDSSSWLDEVESSIERISFMFDEIGKGKSDWAWDTSQTMDHDVGPL